MKTQVNKEQAKLHPSFSISNDCARELNKSMIIFFYSFEPGPSYLISSDYKEGGSLRPDLSSTLASLATLLIMNIRAFFHDPVLQYNDKTFFLSFPSRIPSLTRIILLDFMEHFRLRTV